MAFGHFVLGSHNVMVMALGSCVKWPLARLKEKVLFFFSSDHVDPPNPCSFLHYNSRI